MKKLFCILLTLVLILSCAGPVAASQLTTQSNHLSSASANTPETVNNMQVMFAMLQTDLPDEAKSQAMSQIEQIQALQNEQLLVSQFLNEARSAQIESMNSSAAVTMSAELQSYLDTNALSYPATELDSTGWDAVITTLEGHFEQLNRQFQEEIAQMQEYIGQYSSYLQDANTQISNSNQALTSLARGQSMYGDSAVGFGVTALVLGLLVGCLGTLAIQKLSKKDKKEP